MFTKRLASYFLIHSHHARFAIESLVLAIMVAGGTVMNSTPVYAYQITIDPLITRARTQLANFTGWLARNHVQGYIGEVGWPDNTSGDAAEWNNLANYWYTDADANNLWVTNWATGSWWGISYALSSYQLRNSAAGVNTPNSQAGVIEAHPSTTSYLRGINVNGGEFGTGGTFGNTNTGTYGTNYIYDSNSTFSYLYGRGTRIIRLPFRWERIQPTIGGTVDFAELQRLSDAVSRAGTAGLKVILDMHNYGEYQSNGTRETIGQQVSGNDLANVWVQLSSHFKTNSNVIAYDIMNEPHDIGGSSPVNTWESASQKVLSAIRGNGDTKMIMIPGYNWSNASVWSETQPSPWISDPFNNFRYEAHQYFDSNVSGTYPISYSAEVHNATIQGYKSVVVAINNPVITTVTPSPIATSATSNSVKKTNSPTSAVVDNPYKANTVNPTVNKLDTDVTPDVKSSNTPSMTVQKPQHPIVIAAAHYGLSIFIPVLIILLLALGWIEFKLHHRSRQYIKGMSKPN